MLTDLSFLTPGKEWPPAGERERLKTYADNRKLFEADHADVFKAALARVVRAAQEVGMSSPTSYELCINYPRLISVSTAGLLFNRVPGIVAGEEQDAELMGRVNRIAEDSDLGAVLYDVAIDVSRYGTGLLYIHRDEEGETVIDLTRPDIWFPVVDAANIRRVLYHVLATPYSTQSEQGNPNRLHVEIHEKGRVTVRDYALERGAVGVMLNESTEVTGTKGFAVVPVHNIRPSDSVFGIDDYNDIQSIVCELEVRLGQISKVLDRHTDPTMQGPESALSDVEVEEGRFERVFVPGKYFVNQNAAMAGDIRYITWDAQLAANFEYISRLMDLLRVISEMGTLLADATAMGNVPSGAAMRRLLYPAICKVTRIRNRFTSAIKAAVITACEIDGESMDDKPVYVTWGDPLPRDPLELAKIADIRTNGKQTQSVKRALMNMDDLSEDEAEDELNSIKDEIAEAMPMLDSPTAKNGDFSTDDEREGV